MPFGFFTLNKIYDLRSLVTANAEKNYVPCMSVYHEFRLNSTMNLRGRLYKEMINKVENL